MISSLCGCLTVQTPYSGLGTEMAKVFVAATRKHLKGNAPCAQRMAQDPAWKERKEVHGRQ